MRSLEEALNQAGWGAGATQVILETGVQNTEALGLYRSAGYKPTSSYVPGRRPEINRAFGKSL